AANLLVILLPQQQRARTLLPQVNIKSLIQILFPPSLPFQISRQQELQTARLPVPLQREEGPSELDGGGTKGDDGGAQLHVEEVGEHQLLRQRSSRRRGFLHGRAGTKRHVRGKM
ncbi:unnamed protein product, partial [Urochloa humidicola]